MRVYLCGPMTGYPQFNYPAFYRAAEELRELGFEVVSPAEMDDPEIRIASMLSDDGNLDTLDTHGLTWGDFLSRDVKLLVDDGIEAVVCLQGWEQSKGSRLETFVAYLAGIPVLDGETLVPVRHLRLLAAWSGPSPTRTQVTM